MAVNRLGGMTRLSNNGVENDGRPRCPEAEKKEREREKEMEMVHEGVCLSFALVCLRPK